MDEIELADTQQKVCEGSILATVFGRFKMSKCSDPTFACINHDLGYPKLEIHYRLGLNRPEILDITPTLPPLDQDRDGHVRRLTGEELGRQEKKVPESDIVWVQF